jgi:hypothetical protein
MRRLLTDIWKTQSDLGTEVLRLNMPMPDEFSFIILLFLAYTAQASNGDSHIEVGGTETIFPL